MPATFEDLGELTFEEALEAFDDRFKEHTAFEEERVREQLDPDWARNVAAKRAEHQPIGVKFSSDALAAPPKPYPASAYSRKWEVEHDLIEAKGCIKFASKLIEGFKDGTSNHEHHYGHSCTLGQAIEKEQGVIDKCEEDLKPLEWELAWLNSSTAFDFTAETYQSDPQAKFVLREEGEALNFQLDVERGSRSQWFDLSQEQLAFLRKLDRAVYHAGDAVLPEYRGGGPTDPLIKWMVSEVGGRPCLELVAAGRDLAERDPSFWPRLRDIGPTPGLLREANHILRGAARQEGLPGKTAAIGSRAQYLLFRAHARAPRCSSKRSRGSRRGTNRSTTSSGGSDPPDGGDGPEANQAARQGLAPVGARPQWDATMTGIGLTIGGGLMGSRGMLIGGFVGYLWARHRWPGED